MTNLTNNTNKKEFDFNSMAVNTCSDLGKYRKEKGFFKALSLVGLIDGEIKTLVDIRHYCPTGKKNYVCVWISSPILSLYGCQGGSAGGYGYDRSEASFRQAIEKMGVVTLAWADQRTFLKEFAQHLGVKVYSIVESNA